LVRGLEKVGDVAVLMGILRSPLQNA
jgi:hypothetical protein